jgi:REP element-mobilizing transposase RayT
MALSLWPENSACSIRVIYHVMNRGDRREVIFTDDHDRRLFLDTLGEACLKTDWQVHAWCLMNNHFHLVVETPRANLVDGMQWLLGVYTNRFNHRQKEFGHLFSGRYKVLIVDGSGNGYLKTVCDYVHLNPEASARNHDDAELDRRAIAHGSGQSRCLSPVPRLKEWRNL